SGPPPVPSTASAPRMPSVAPPPRAPSTPSASRMPSVAPPAPAPAPSAPPAPPVPTTTRSAPPARPGADPRSSGAIPSAAPRAPEPDPLRSSGFHALGEAQRIDTLLHEMATERASDLHLCPGCPAAARVDGEIRFFTGRIVGADEVQE